MSRTATVKGILIFMGFVLTVSEGLWRQTHAEGYRVEAETARDQKTGASRRLTSRTKSEDINKSLTMEQERALQILAQLSETISSWKPVEWTVRVQARIADLLWNYDEERARRDFEEIFHSVDSVIPAAGPDKDSSAGRLPARFLRSEVLSLISSHDPDMAERLITALETGSGNSKTPSTAASVAKEKAFLTLQMAAALVDTDPSRAADLINSSLGVGLTSWFVPTLQAIRRKNPALANEIFVRALSLAQEDAEHSNKNMCVLAASLFPEASGGMLITAGAEEDEDRVDIGFDLSSSPAGPAAGPVVTDQFLNFVYKTFMQTQVPTDTVRAEEERVIQVLGNSMTVHRLLPLFDQHLPDKSAMLRARLSEIGKNFKFDEGQSFDTLLNHLNPGTNPEDLIRQAQAQKDPTSRDVLYQQAAQVAARNGQMDQVQSILEKVSNEEFKRSIRAAAAYEAVTNALDRNDLDTAYGELKNLPGPLDQARFLTQMAQKLLDQKDNTRAAHWLLEAEQLAGKAEDGSGRVHQLLYTAEAIVQLDSDRGLSLMTSIVDEINAESRKAAETKTGQEAGRPDRGPDLLVASTLLENKLFSHLARVDFEVALSLAQSIIQAEGSVARCLPGRAHATDPAQS